MAKIDGWRSASDLKCSLPLDAMDIAFTTWVAGLCWIAFGLIASLSLWTAWRDRWRERESLSHRVVCPRCLHAYEVDHRVGVDDCPGCGSRIRLRGRIGL